MSDHISKNTFSINNSSQETTDTHPQYIPHYHPSQYPHNTSSIISYFNETQTYLHRKFSENTDINFSNSSHFIPKEHALINNNNPTNNNTQNSNSEDKCESNEEEEQNEFDDEYGELMPTGKYYQQHINTNMNSQQTQMMNFGIPQHYANALIHPMEINSRPRFHSLNCMNVNSFLSMFQQNNNNLYRNNQEMFGGQNLNNENSEWNVGSGSNGGQGKKNKKRKYTNDEGESSMSGKGKQQFCEREGDWICFNCNNLNFAFRTVCNRCQLSKEESVSYTLQSYKNTKNTNDA